MGTVSTGFRLQAFVVIMDLAKRYIDEKLPKHWDVDESPASFRHLLNHIVITTNFKAYFEKEISNPLLYTIPEGMVVADIGAGVGWTSALLALKPEVKKVYVVEPSKERLKRAPFVAKHFNVPEHKLEFINGNFLQPNIPEKVHLVCLSSSFHHCWDKYVPVMLQNLKKILIDETSYAYEDYLNRKIKVHYNGKILLASEHYVRWMWTFRRMCSYFKNIKNRHMLPFGPGKWRNPDPISSEHWRTKKEIEKFVKQAGFKMKMFLHDGDSCSDKKWNWHTRMQWQYYYAILEPSK